MRKIKINTYYFKILLKIFFYSKIYIYLFFFLSYFLYYKSLESCTKGEDKCTKMKFWIRIKIKEVIFSCLMMIILFELILYKVISRLHLIHMIFNFILFYLYSHGLNFEDHGLYNLRGFIILFIIFFIIFLPINALIYFIKEKNTKIIIFLHIIKFISFLFLFNVLFNMYTTNCNDWPKGLNNTSIDNNSKKYGCQIVFPKRCPYHLFKNFLDFTKIIGKECKKFHINAKQKILKLTNSPYINETVNHIGYPLTNKNLSCNIDFIDRKNLMKKCFLENLVDLENKEVLNQYFKNKIPEVEVDFSNNQYGEMNINLNYNKTLSEERILHEKYSTPYSNNIIILFIDSVSRVNSLRQLKKTLNFFEKFMSYNGVSLKKSPSEKFHGFQFFKYHSFKYSTPYNYPILFYGSMKIKKVLITKHLKENGYVTCFSGELCAKDNARTMHNLTNEEFYDHQFIICDPNREHININTIKCLYGKKNIEHLYEYGDQFWRKYQDNRKFLSIVSNDGHEGTLEVLKYADNVIFNFINNLFKDSLLKNTSIFLLSDHGVKMPSIYYPYDFYKIEYNLPMLYMIINDRKNISYEEQYNNIYKNQQTFITSYDIYNTIGNLIFGDKYNNIKNKTKKHDTPKSPYGKSLFEKINQKSRNPKLYKNVGPMTKNVCKNVI